MSPWAVLTRRTQTSSWRRSSILRRSRTGDTLAKGLRRCRHRPLTPSERPISQSAPSHSERQRIVPTGRGVGVARTLPAERLCLRPCHHTAGGHQRAGLVGRTAGRSRRDDSPAEHSAGGDRLRPCGCAASERQVALVATALRCGVGIGPVRSGGMADRYGLDRPRGGRPPVGAAGRPCGGESAGAFKRRCLRTGRGA